jgi:hypothetical protein
VAKKRIKKNVQQTLQIDPQKLRKQTDWNSLFDPKGKRLIPVDIVVGMAGFGFDSSMVMAILITNWILKEVRDGLDGVNHKTANPGALAEWRGLLQAAVYAHLKAGGDWNKDGAKVLVVARDMGTIAGLLAGGNTEAGQNQLKAAFAATKTHTTCTGSGIGGGAWCTFDWI